MFARFVALAVTILGAWMFAINLIELDFEGWVLSWILASGLAGVCGGVIYMLGIDGPRRFRTRARQMLGWWLMLASVLLPTSLSVFMVPLVVAVLPGFLIMRNPERSPPLKSQ